MTTASDGNAATSLKALVEWLKQNLLAIFGTVGGAMTLLGNLEPLLELSNFVQFIVDHWREWTHAFWHWLGSLVSLHISKENADLLSFIAFIVAVHRYSKKVHLRTVPSNGLTYTIAYLAALSFGAISSFIILMGSAEVEDSAWSVFIGSTALVTMTINFVVFLLTKNPFKIEELAATTVAFCKVYLVFAVFLALNQIGLYSEQIKAWFESATS